MNVPDGWTKTSLGELASSNAVFCDGDWVESKDQDPEGDVRLIQLADIGDGLYKSKSRRFLTSVKASELRCTFLKPGDLLIARMPDPLGRTCIFPGDPKSSVTVVDVCIVRLSDDIDHRWLMHAMNSPAMRNQIASLQSGSTRKRISRKNLATVQLLVPPLVEQYAIVAKIESMISELDRGAEQLEAVRTQLGRYRQSVLKAAFEGRLTAAWREERRRQAEKAGGALPTAGDLLERIRAERDSAYTQRIREWEQATKAWEAAGGKASGEKKPRKPVEPTDVDPLSHETLSSLPVLPTGWAWCGLESIVEGGRTCAYGVLKPGTNPKNGVPLIRVGDLVNGTVNQDELRHIEPNLSAEFARTVLEGGEFLISLVGAIGRTAIVPDDLAGANTARAVGVVPLTTTVVPKYVEYFFRRSSKIAEMTSLAHEVARKTLNLEDVRRATIAIAPPDEQAEIVNEIDSRLSVVDQIERTIDTALKQAQSLRQSILKRAFEGRLLTETELEAVRADPAYEPAEKLLARIRAERSTAETKPKKKVRRKRTPQETA